MSFERITVDPDQMAGVPSIRGLRIPVATVVEMVAEGMTEDEILSRPRTRRYSHGFAICGRSGARARTAAGPQPVRFLIATPSHL